ncbi:MAG TPA: sigma-70 family RNA polymerase sigma factor [Terriglobales bacterium]
MEARVPIVPIADSGGWDEEGRLLAGVLAKDRKATAEFVDRCADWLYPFLRRRLLPRSELVEDLMQEVLLAAWQGLPDFRRDASLRAWILGIARHKVEDYYRKQLRDADATGDDDAAEELAVVPLFDEHLDMAARQGRVQQVLSALPEAYALALIWRYREEKTVREMAQLAGKTEKAMERLLARARENFRKRWSDAQP